MESKSIVCLLAFAVRSYEEDYERRLREGVS